VSARPLPILAAVALAACGTAGTGNEAAANQVVEAGTARPVPCQVQAHAMSAVQNSLQGKPGQGDCDNSVDPQTMPLDQLERIMPSQHPAFYYVLATRLFEANRKEDAGFWFYAGQLRYRIRLACHPELAPDGEPALFASLSETAGAPINDFLGSDPGQWADVMRRALEWAHCRTAQRHGPADRARPPEQGPDPRRTRVARPAEPIRILEKRRPRRKRG
jgi:hypothetical protein